MSITSITTDFAGETGVRPRIVRVQSTDSFATVTTQNYLKPAIQSFGFTFYQDDIVAVSYDTNTSQFFTLNMSGGNITLVPQAGSVTLPVTANHIAVYANTAGALTDDAATAINGGNIQAGLSGTAGTLASFPATASKGSLRIAAVANSGNTVTTISNAAMGQATTLTIPDPAGATGNIVVAAAALVNNNLVKASGTAGLVADVGARILSGTTGTFAGGGTSNAFSVTGLTSAAVGSAVIRTSTNAVSIVKALPGTNTLTITFSGDPGASTTVDYIYTTAGLT